MALHEMGFPVWVRQTIRDEDQPESREDPSRRYQLRVGYTVSTSICTDYVIGADDERFTRLGECEDGLLPYEDAVKADLVRPEEIRAAELTIDMDKLYIPPQQRVNAWVSIFTQFFGRYDYYNML